MLSIFTKEINKTQFFLEEASLLCNRISNTVSGVPRKFGGWGGVQQIQLRTDDRENGDLGGGSPLVRGSGGSCNLVQEILFQIVEFLNFWHFKIFYDANLFICHCKPKEVANVGSHRILLPFFRTSWGVGVLNSAIFKLIRMLE